VRSVRCGANTPLLPASAAKLFRQADALLPAAHNVSPHVAREAAFGDVEAARIACGESTLRRRDSGSFSTVRAQRERVRSPVSRAWSARTVTFGLLSSKKRTLSRAAGSSASSSASSCGVLPPGTAQPSTTPTQDGVLMLAREKTPGQMRCRKALMTSYRPKLATATRSPRASTAAAHAHNEKKRQQRWRATRTAGSFATPRTDERAKKTQVRNVSLQRPRGDVPLQQRAC
jgi:hypothetical protein